MRKTTALLQCLLMIGGCLLSTACSDDGGNKATASNDDDATDAGGDATDMIDTDDDDDADEPAPTTPQGKLESVDETAQWTLPGLTGPVYVVRTEGNIPHIYAENPTDLYRVEGFLMAQDRYIEFELGRRIGLGQASALLGDAALFLDQQSRGLGRAQITDRLVANLTEEQGAIFDAYAEGINAYIERVRDGELPPPSELVLLAPLLGGDPVDFMEPVDRRGVIGLLTVIVSQLGFETVDIDVSAVEATLEARFEGAAFEELRRAGAADDLFLSVGPVKPVTASQGGWGIEGAGQSKAARPDAGWRGRADLDVNGAQGLASAFKDKKTPLALLERARRWTSLENRLLRHTGEHGSNVWAVGGPGTPGGGSVFANDGHLPLGVPPLFWQVGLDTRELGGGDIHQLGQTFPGVPIMTVGTNGDVAWGQTYLYADITDWYREEIQLGEDGKPAASFFDGEWRPLTRVEERYEIAQIDAAIDLLDSEGRVEVWERWETFDGRLIVGIEGRALESLEEAQQGEVVVTMQGDLVVPGDTDGDQVITALSLYTTGLDVGATVSAVDGFHKARNVDEWREQTRKLIAYAQGMVASDKEGNVTYTGFNAIPCREYLDRNPDGTWVEGADPRRLLDGTRYGRPSVPINEDREVDQSPQQREDPYRCTIPFERFPQSVNPARGYVSTANNDPAGITTDGSIADDPFYMGDAWSPGYRADTIDARLAELTSAQDATVETMADLQADVRSRLGQDLAPELIAWVQQAQLDADGDGEDLTPDRQRAADLYAANRGAFDEAAQRLQSWLERGAQARSGVVTFYNPDVDDVDRLDAVATMIFNAWYRAFFNALFDDEGFDDLFWAGTGNANSNRTRALFRALASRGPDNPAALASWNPQTQESVFFDVLGTDTVETSHELAISALDAALKDLAAPQSAPGVGGFGTDDMDQWLWGMRHLVRLPSLLVTFIGDDSGIPAVDLVAEPLALTPRVLPLDDYDSGADPRRSLPWFPVDGDWFAVDAANPSRAEDFMVANGPVMRMVIALDENGVRGQNTLPGGQSGLTDSPFFADQAALWLGNQTAPLRFTLDEVIDGATGRETFTPQD